MKKLLLTICLVLMLAPAISLAHILKIDGNIGVTIHVNPNDDPIIGEPASFFLEIKDKTNKFNPADCNCTASIVQNGQTLFSSGIFMSSSENDLDNPFFSYTFPAKGIYTFKVEGSPKSGDSFQKFTVTYDLRVERGSGEAKSNSGQSSAVWIGVGVALFAAIFGATRLRKKPSA